MTFILWPVCDARKEEAGQTARRVSGIGGENSRRNYGRNFCLCFRHSVVDTLAKIEKFEAVLTNTLEIIRQQKRWQHYQI
jgi:hypothetical protein